MIGLEMYSWVTIAIFHKYVTVVLWLSYVVFLMLICVLLYMRHRSLCSSTDQKYFSSE